MDRADTSLSTLQDIKTIMNRSTLFLSLSGWSGIMAGSICLLASGIAYQWLQATPAAVPYEAQNELLDFSRLELIRKLLLLAVATFVLVFVVVFLNTRKKAEEQNRTIWDPAARKMAAALFIPIFTGALFILGLIRNDSLPLAAPASLVFYGLGLVSTSKYTFSDIRYLGFLEIALGIGAMFLPQLGLLAWAIGFGVLHIIYGILMFKKADS